MPYVPGSTRTAGGGNPLTLDEYKEHARIDGDEYDLDVAAKAADALAFCEDATGRQFVSATWQFAFNRFPAGGRPQRLPRAPLTAVTQIDYVASDGTATTINAAGIAAGYKVATRCEPGMIAPAWGTTWPEERRELEAVVYTCTCGWAADAVDPRALALLKLMFAHLWENREATISGTIARDLPRGIGDLIEQLVYDDLVDYDPAEQGRIR